MVVARWVLGWFLQVFVRFFLFSGRGGHEAAGRLDVVCLSLSLSFILAGTLKLP